MRGRIADFTPKELIAEVSSQTRPLEWGDSEVPCLVIEYRDKDEVKARTWVHARTEQVLRQEAFLFGQTLSIRREAPKGGGQ